MFMKQIITEKVSLLPLDSIEIMEDELMFVLGGATMGGGSGCGCGCSCSSGKGCGCDCGSGSGCGCGCVASSPGPTPLT